MNSTQVKNSPRESVFATGLALFSMFFGAGNLVFPLVIGKNAGSENGSAVAGLSISAVLFPLLGLMAMMMYGGCLKSFLSRLGKWPAFAMMFILFMSQGPVGAMPRLITLMHASVKGYFPDISLSVFSVCMTAIIFWMTIRPGRIIPLIGVYLTPVLLGTLALLIGVGLFHAEAPQMVTEGSLHHFCTGFKGGYQTLDLTAALLFVSVVMPYLSIGISGSEDNARWVRRRMIGAGLLAAGLLMISYIGLAWLSSHYASTLGAVADADLLYLLAVRVLGPWGSLIATSAVFLACLTTAISLASVFSKYLQEEWFRGKVALSIPLALTLGVTAAMATIGFSGIMKIWGPVLEILYPSLIVLCLLNIANRLYGIQLLRGPVFGMFLIGVVGYIIS
jgi:LIVCS family branched-chain amino acid:cation transporter